MDLSARQDINIVPCRIGPGPFVLGSTQGEDTCRKSSSAPWFPWTASCRRPAGHLRFDLLLGRKTYEIFAAYWPYYDESPPHGSIAKLFNEIKKYAVSRSGEVDTSWQGSVLLRDIADVKRLRDEDGPNLVTQGSTELVHALLANDLVDAMTIFTVPVVLGGGKKLFDDGSAPHAYQLTRSRVSSTGVLISRYERDGEIKIRDTALDSPSKREIARQERMKREG